MTRETQQEPVTIYIQEWLQSAGSHLEPAVWAVMEDRFGRSFEHVRVHNDALAAASARAMGARAYTLGSHIVFGEGYYDPETRSGQRLLAHELVHVIQQGCDATPAHVGDSHQHFLEHIADQAAELIVAGGSLPSGFRFGRAPKGLIQCHEDEECPGTRYSARERSIWMAANEAIELAYKNDPKNRNHVMLFGSDFEDSLLKIGPEMPFPVPNRRPSRPGVAEIALPKGVRNQRFGNLLLSKLRGLERQRRPDIIDFTNRAFYEIKSTGYADRGTVQLQSYYKIAEEIRMHHGENEPPWKLDTAPPWYPHHVLSMLSPNPQSLSLIVCTEATDQVRYPGMILYEVRRVRQRRRRQRPREIRIEAFWSEYDIIRPMVRASLPKAIPFYDPDSPDYVIIVPHEFFSLDFVKRITEEVMKRRWEPFKVQSQFSRNRLRPSSIPGLTPENFLMFALVVAAAGVVSVIVMISGAAIVEGVAAGATALTSAEAGATAATGTAAGVESTIVVPSSIAAQVAGGTATAATTAEAASLASYQAMIASPVAQKLAASAGVALILGTAKSVQAAPSNTATATIGEVIAIRAVPIDHFRILGDMPHAFSAEWDSVALDTPSVDKTKFDVGRKVYFDNKQHWIFGRLAIR